MQYLVDVDLTVSKQFYIEAENEEDVKKQVNDMIANEPNHYAGGNVYVTHEIIDVVENE